MLVIVFLFSGCSMKDNSVKPFTVKSLKKTYTQIDRIEKVAYPILVSNKQLCSKLYNNYGLTIAMLNTDNTVKNKEIWMEALSIKSRPTIIRIIPHSVASSTGLKKTNDNNRGAISKLLGLYGPYMPTEKRIQYLRKFIHQKKTTEN